MWLRLILVVVSTSASAASVGFHYERPAGSECPNESEMRRLIAARLGADVFTDPAQALVSVRIRHEDAFHAEIQLENPTGVARGKRVLSSDSCPALATSVAVTVALTIDPVIRRKDEPPAPPPVQEPVVAVEPVIQPPKESPPAQTPVIWMLSAGASANTGLSLGFQPTLRLEGRVRWTLFSMGLEGRFGWPVTGALPQGQLTTSSFLGAAVPCIHWKFLSGCLDASVGALRLEGQELIAARQGTVFQALIGARVLAAYPVTDWFSLALMIEGQAPLTRPSVLVGTTRVWTVPPLGGGLGGWLIFVL